MPLKSATFKRDATGKWYVSLVAEFDLPDLPKPSIETETAIGIDVGFDRFATDSDGGIVENPRFFRKVQHVALRRPETMKRTIKYTRVKKDERWSEVVKALGFNSKKSLTRVAQTSPKLSHRQAPEGR